jgi:protein TonB
MKKLFLLLAFFSFQFVNAQTNDEKEYSPTFPGGIDSMYAFIEKNIKYPVLAKDSINEVKVMLKFAIMTDGKVDKIEVLSNTPKQFNEEAVRVFQLMPKWIPGMQYGRPVTIYFTIPIVFNYNK